MQYGKQKARIDADERKLRIESYGSAYEQLIAALATFPRDMWQFRPSVGAWSIHELVIHLADTEANCYGRLRRGIAEPGSAIFAYDPDAWATELHYHDQDCDEALHLFKWLRRLSFKLIQSLPEDAWARTMEHPQNGTMTLDDWLVCYDDHALAHIKQMQACYQVWQAKQR